MSDPTSYELEHFIPFTAEVYLRLLERMGEAFWPLHLLTLALGAAAMVFSLRGQGRITCLLVAPLWAFVGIAFVLQRYAELNWAGGYLGQAFLVQSVLLVIVAILGRGLSRTASPGWAATVTGVLLVLVGLVAYPLIAPLTGQPWQQAETFGIHPDPTAITTLGLGLLALRAAALWCVAIIPICWLILSVLTLTAIDVPWTFVPATTLLITLGGLAGKTWARR